MPIEVLERGLGLGKVPDVIPPAVEEVPRKVHISSHHIAGGTGWVAANIIAAMARRPTRSSQATPWTRGIIGRGQSANFTMSTRRTSSCMCYIRAANRKGGVEDVRSGRHPLQ